MFKIYKQNNSKMPMERPRIYEQHQYRGLRRVDANDHALNSKVTKSEKK